MYIHCLIWIWIFELRCTVSIYVWMFNVFDWFHIFHVFCITEGTHCKVGLDCEWKTLSCIMSSPKQKIWMHCAVLSPTVVIIVKKGQNSIRTTKNDTNKRSESFYIGSKGFAIQNSIISEMFLCMVNVMGYGIQHFLEIIQHQYVMKLKNTNRLINCFTGNECVVVRVGVIQFWCTKQYKVNLIT